MGGSKEPVEAIGGPDEAAAAALFDLCSNLIAVFDESGIVLTANPAWERVLGHRLDDVIGHHITRFVHPDDVAATMAAGDRLADGAELRTFQNRFIAADGRIRWMSWTARIDRALRRAYAVGTDVTDGRASQDALRDAEEQSMLLRGRLESTLASIADGFLAVDGDSICTYINDGAARLLGFPRDQVLGRKLWDDYPPSVGRSYRVEWEQALATQTSRVLKYHSERRGRSFEISLYPWPDGMSAHFRDVTEREEAARVRDEIERQLRGQASLLRTAHDSMIACTLEGVVTYWNPAAEQMYGWSAEEAVGRNLRSLVRRPGQDLDAEALRGTAERGGWTGRLWHVHRDGRRIAVEVSTSIVRDDDGTPAAVFVVSTDVSERVALEDRLNDALEVGGMAAWEYDIREDRVWRQEQFDRLFGYEPSGEADDPVMEHDWTRSRFLEHVLAEDLTTLVEVERGAVATGRFSVDFRVRWPDGSIHWLTGRGGILYDDGGRPERARGTLLDITERRTLEAERVVLEQQLAQARRMEAVGRLAGGVAHDFNNLLTVINGYAELAQHRSHHDPVLREQLDAVALAGARAADLTQQLLSLSRRQRVELRPIDLNHVIGDAGRLLSRLIGGDIDVVMSLADDLPAVLGDDGQLSQVVINLAVNARDAMAGGGELRIETAIVDTDLTVAAAEIAAGAFVRLSIADTGRGMDADTLARAFEPFFTTKPTGQGTGLGLSTVYGIVEQSGGHLDVRTRPGEGTAVDVFLPVAAPATVRTDESAAPSDARPSAHVLLVEDDPSVRALVADMLCALGYRATAVDGPLAALDTAVDDVDVVLTDVLMPGMNGRELGERLRAKGRPDHLAPMRIVYMSGFASTVISDQFPLEAEHGFLQKPFGLDELRERLQKAVDR